MSTSQQSPIENLDDKTALRARVVELERENDLLKQVQRAHTEAGGGLQTSGTEGTPELGSLQHIYRAAPIGLCCLDKKLRYVIINEWLAAINGLPVKEHVGRPISEVLPDVAAGVEAQLRGVIETGEPVVGGTVKAETAAEPGVKRHFQHNYDAIRSADGAIVGVSCVVQDITERKQAEEALRVIVEGTSWASGEDFFRSLTRHLTLALGVRSAFVSELLEGSEARLRLLAYWEGNDFGENFEYDVEGTPCELVLEKGLTHYPANVQQLFPDDRWLEESRIESYLAVPLLDSEGNRLGHLGVVDDKPMPKSLLAESILRIFAARAGGELLRKRAEEALRLAHEELEERVRKRTEELLAANKSLRQSEERFALALEATSEGLWDWNIATGEMFCSPPWCKALGFDPSEVEPHIRFWNRLMHPEDMPRLTEALNAHFENKTELFECEVRLRTKSGEYRWILDRGKVVARDENGKPLRMVGVDVDITERKRADEELLESRERFRQLAENIGEVFWLTDWAQRKLLYVSPAYETIFGRSCASLYEDRRSWADHIHPDDKVRTVEAFRQKAELGQYCEEEYRINHPQRGIRWIRDRAYPLRDEAGTVHRIVGLAEDITARKRVEEQARQLQADLAHMSRLSSMGEMASGLAHELNQPLTVITNYAQGCVRRLKSNAIGPEELGDILGRIATQAQRSSSIIRGLGNLVRKSSALRSVIDINHCIMEVADLADAEAVQYRAKARFELEPNLPPVMADQTQLQQVILNLVQNGCEAIQDTPESRRAVTVRTKQRGDRELEISVSDDGRGISESLGERVFEPFFTTKAQGIGMGLAISRSIVESHGGRLWATPNPDQGTTFYFTLPIVRGGSGDE